MGVGQYFETGKAVAKKHLWRLVAVVFVIAALEVLGQNISEVRGGLVLSVLFTLFVTAPLRVGGSWTFLLATRKDSFMVGEVFSVFSRNYLAAVGASFMSGLFIIIGLILLIIPGIIMMVRLVFVGYLIMDKDLSAWQAIKESWKLTRTTGWSVFSIYLIGLLMFIGVGMVVGLLSFFGPAGMVLAFIVGIVGFFWVTIWLFSTIASMYNDITSSKKTSTKSVAKRPSSTKKSSKKSAKKSTKKSSKKSAKKSSKKTSKKTSKKSAKKTSKKSAKRT